MVNTIKSYLLTLPAREKRPNTEFLMVRIFPDLEWIWTRKNSVFGHFSHSVHGSFLIPLGIIIIQLIYRNNIMKFDESENKALSFNFLKKSRENYFCIIRKDWNFCDWILQAATILDKKLKIFIFIFFNQIFFFWDISHFKIDSQVWNNFWPIKDL